ncbi:MAG: GerMN domain-containing protein [Christensenellaceae bacterium]
MKKKVKSWISICLLFVMATGMVACAKQAPPVVKEETAVQINPLPEAINKDKATARLYFGYMQEPLLVGESMVVDVPINENVETAIIKKLINGPSTARVDFVQLINPATKVVDVTPNDSGFLTVTLSKEFLLPVETAVDNNMEENPYEKTRKYLAVYSIVNTIIEQGNYSRVRILIDDEGTGTGRTITQQEAGLDGTGATEPFARNGEIELNSKNTMIEILDAIEKKNWTKLYEYIAYKNAYGQDKPSIDDFISEVDTSKLAISDTAVGDSIVSIDGLNDVVMVDYMLKLRVDEVKSFANVPIKLVQENNIWKISYNVFKKNFMY